MTEYPNKAERDELYDYLEDEADDSITGTSMDFDREDSEIEDGHSSEHAIPAVFEYEIGPEFTTLNKVANETGFVVSQVGSTDDSGSNRFTIFFRKVDTEVTTKTVTEEVEGEVTYFDPREGEQVIQDTTREIEYETEEVEVTVQ